MSSSGYESARILLLDRDLKETGEEIEVLFNPTEYSLDKSVEYGEVSLPGMDTPVSQFVAGKAETLSMDLLLDTYESKADVSKRVDSLKDLVSVDGETHAPPRCKFAWADLRFTAVVESLKTTYTLFLPDGTPVRADVSITFKQYETVSTQLERERRESTDYTKRRRVVAGESLWALAASEYGDPGRWRVIAEENDISNPRSLEPGRELFLPPLDT